MRAHFVISVVGPDRPGIVDEVSRIVADNGCNIEDSRMAHLGGAFAVMMLVSGEGDSPGRAAEKVQAWAAGQEMTAVARPTTGPAGEERAAADIGLEMPDRPGIVSRVTHFLAERGANVEALETGVRPAPFTGTPTFAMHVHISSAGKIPPEELRRALEDLAEDEDIHITVGKAV
jgi:glycine cleavage system transcriptional repressor